MSRKYGRSAKYRRAIGYELPPLCNGKLSFTSSRAAFRKAERVFEEGLGKQFVYLCPNCFNYHLTKVAREKKSNE